MKYSDKPLALYLGRDICRAFVLVVRTAGRKKSDTSLAEISDRSAFCRYRLLCGKFLSHDSFQCGRVGERTFPINDQAKNHQAET